MRRHTNALVIQEGAVNIAAICNSILRACKECADVGIDPRGDAAVRLMVHQLAWLTKQAELQTPSQWLEAWEICKGNGARGRESDNA